MNIQQNIHKRQETTYNFQMPNYDADKFAEWLTSAFENSHFKSFSSLADAAGLTRSTVSSLANARPQSLTNKPSQPSPETVLKLAKALGEDIDQALLLAGHAPQSSPIPESIAAIGFNGLDDEDLKEIAEFIRFRKMRKQLDN